MGARHPLASSPDHLSPKDPTLAMRENTQRSDLSNRHDATRTETGSQPNPSKGLG